MFPQICSLVSIWIHGVALALSVGQSFVEWHEECLRSIHLCCEEGLVLIHGEVGEASSEVEYGVLRTAVFLVLLLSVVCCRLECPWVLQFEGKQRQSVDEYHHIDFVAWLD